MSKWVASPAREHHPRVRALVALVALAVLALLATRSVAVQGESWAASALDPTGDAFGFSPQHDVTQLSMSSDGIYLELTLSFAGGITYWGGGPSGVGGYIDLDTDQRAHTGAVSHVSGYPQCGASNLGIEFYVDMSSYST